MSHFKGDRTHRFGGKYFSKCKGPDTPETPAPPLGKLVRTLDRTSLNADSIAFKDTAIIADCSFVASYNWVDGKGKDSTILVPGRSLARSEEPIAIVLIFVPRKAAPVGATRNPDQIVRRLWPVFPRQECCSISRTSHGTSHACNAQYDAGDT
jgi:hypothetical protein